MRAGRIQEAVYECMATPHPVGPVAAEVLRNAHQSGAVVEEKMHIALSEQRLQLERNLGVLGTMATRRR